MTGDGACVEILGNEYEIFKTRKRYSLRRDSAAANRCCSAAAAVAKGGEATEK